MPTFTLLGGRFRLTDAELARAPHSVLSSAAACDRDEAEPIAISDHWQEPDLRGFEVREMAPPGFAGPASSSKPGWAADCAWVLSDPPARWTGAHRRRAPEASFDLLQRA